MFDSTLKLTDLAAAGKRVLMRVDFNVPLSEGEIRNPARIQAALPSIRHLIEQGASVVLMSHLGRPKGQVVPELSLAPVAHYLSQELGQEVLFLPSCRGKEVQDACKALKAGQVALLENLRFHPEETKKGCEQAQILAFEEELTALGELYVNDAFGTAHRAHASVVGIKLPQRAAGFLLQKELDAFGKILSAPDKPVLAILGGAKVADKIQLIENLLDKVDAMIIGGAMAYTFKKVVEGVEIGASLYDEQGAKIAQSLVDRAKASQTQLHFPIDHVVAPRFAADAPHHLVSDQEGVPEGHLALDTGPMSNECFAKACAKAHTIIWNGPVGVFEMPAFANGTQALAKEVAKATKRGATTVIGGGDTATAALAFGIADQVSHLSTGGGASLELLEGKVLPGIAALSQR